MALHLKVEHLVLKTLGDVKGEGGRWLLAVSGGADSIVMAEVLFRWRRYLGVELAVAHVHHGSGRPEQIAFRDGARHLVWKWALSHGIEFFTNTGEMAELRSEQEFREFRLRHLAAWVREGKYTKVAFAHHRDDLLETRLLRLIRGSGAQGLKAMAPSRGKILRPLLSVSRAEILAYSRARALTWVEDPSNLQVESMRSWLRQQWLPQLERRSPGATKSLSRSLTTLAGERFTETIGPFVGLRRAALEEFPLARREDIVARYLRSIGIKGYSQTHVQELLKRLGTRQTTVRFEMLGFSFQATPDFLWASRV